MEPRPIETILAEWRAAEADRQDISFNPDLEARIERLRLEHADAVAAREAEAEELRRTKP